MCGPLGPAGGLPATQLEAQEPERLYALVTRDRAVDPERYAPDDLVPLPGGVYQARAEVAEQLGALLAAGAEAGHVHSEHQLGLAVDVTGACGGFECFGDSDDGRWVAANAHRFGFIVR